MNSADRKKWLEKFVEQFMFHDVQVCIDGNANFAGALALSVYTDALGGLINGKLAESGVSELNYTTFLERMGYSPAQAKKYYDAVRCGLAHQYFIKGEHVVGTMTPEVGSKGMREALDVICFINEAYFEEFKKAYFQYKADLLAGQGNLPANFDKALSDPTIPYAVKSYADSSAVQVSLSVGAVSGVSLIFVPEMGPWPPKSTTTNP